MRKVFITLGIIIIILVAALFILPTFFKGDIIRIIQRQIEKNIDAEVVIGDVQLSMFKSFPSLNVSVENVSIAGKGEFAKDTIMYIPLFEASANIKSLISGNEIIINRILLKDTRIAPMVAASGKANWDILISNDTVTGQTDDNEQTSPKTDDKKENLLFNDIEIKHLSVAYRDIPTSTYAAVSDINMQLSGNFSESHTLIKIALALNNISYQQGDNAWISQMNMAWDAEIGANLKDLIFDLQKSNLSVNDLRLALAGQVAMPGDKYQVDLKLDAPDTKFESLLALVPKNLKHYTENLKATGEFSLNIAANGEFYQNHLPMFDARLIVNNADVQYSGLPEAIRQINIDAHITNPGGSIDSTVLDLKRMSFDIAGNPFSMFLKVANLNDPSLKGGAKGVINFSNLKNALPLKEITLEGTVTTDVTFDGKYQYIEKEQYEKFMAKGDVSLKNILFKNTDFPQGISVPQGKVAITPASLNLNDLQVKIYSSDFMLKGHISNYLPYIFKNDVLRGNFSVASNLINLNEFMAPSVRNAQKAVPAEKGQTTVDTSVAPAAAPVATPPSSTTNALEIPRNINIQLATNINTILFDKLTIKNVTGNISLADAVATLKDLKMNMLEGSIVMNGKYNAIHPQAPVVDFGVDVTDFDVKAAFNSFTFIRQSLPIAMNCQGKISADMKFTGTMDKEMNLVMNTLNGGGFVESKGILINDNPAMNQLAGFLKNDELSRLSINYLKVNFKLENGNIIVEPFKTTLGDNPVTIYGQQSVDGNLDYTFSANVNRKYFGKEINNLLQAIPGSNKINALDIDIKLSGTLSKPIIKPNLDKALNTIRKEAENELKNKAKDGIIKGLEKLFK